MDSSQFNGTSLNGGYEDTLSSVALNEQGDLVIELIDCAGEFIAGSGSNHAYRLIIEQSEKTRLIDLLLPTDQHPLLEVYDDPDQLLLWIMKTHFSDYYAVYAWLQQHDIRYKATLDRWA